MPKIIKIGEFNFERFDYKFGRRTGYDGFCLSTAGLYMTRATSKKYENVSHLLIYYESETDKIKLTPPRPEDKYKFRLGQFNNQRYIATTSLQKLMPKGRYIYKEDHEGSRCYQLEPKVEPQTNQPQKNV